MNLVRASLVALALLLPASWTIAHADDKPAETKKEGKKKKAKKADKDKGDMGDMKMDK